MKGGVYYNGELAGILEKSLSGNYTFTYADQYFSKVENPPVSLTFPKTKQQYQSPHLFPFFVGLLSEGVNKEIQCRLLKIDEDDDFSRLLQTAELDTIGAITIKKIEE